MGAQAVTGSLIRFSDYDDPSDDSPRERAERVALTRFQRDLGRARTTEAMTEAQQQLDDALAAARAL